MHGIFVLGTNSEFYALDEAEKQAVIATTVEHVAGRVPVYAGTGAESTREAVRLTRMAERERVQGVSAATSASRTTACRSGFATSGCAS